MRIVAITDFVVALIFVKFFIVVISFSFSAAVAFFTLRLLQLIAHATTHCLIKLLLCLLLVIFFFVVFVRFLFIFILEF